MPSLRPLGFALERAVEGLIEGGFGLLVFRRRDLALPAFDFELEEFFFQCIAQHGVGTGRRSRPDGGRCESWGGSVLVLVEMHGRWHGGSSLLAHQSAGGGLLPQGYINSAHDQSRSDASEDLPAVFLQRVGSIDGWAESATGAVIGLVAGIAIGGVAFLGGLERAF